VRLFTPAEMVSIFELRQVLEGLAARRAAESITEQQMVRLKHFFEGFSLPIPSSDLMAYAREDRAFHQFIADLGSREFLSSVLQSFNLISFSYQFDSSEGLVRPPAETIPEHLAIIDAVCRRASGEAERLMRRHFEKAIVQITEGAGGSGGPLIAE
jgi:DNA-binding GntR family transcriptional regulator